MRRIDELISVVRGAFPNDRFFESFAESCRANAIQGRYYRTYDDALRLLDAHSWQVLRKKAVEHFLNHRDGQMKQGFFNQLNEAFAYRHLVRCGYRKVRMLSESQRSMPDICYTESGQVKHCEVKTLGISDKEIRQRSSGLPYDGSVYYPLDDRFFQKFRSAFQIARKQIASQKTDGLVYFVIIFDDFALDYYNEYRRQLVSYCRKQNLDGLYIKVGLRGNRRVCNREDR